MMAYIAHSMNDSEDFRTRLETIKSDVVAARKLVEEGVGLLRMTEEEEKEVAQAEARWLAEEKEAIMAGNNKTDEETRRLRQELRAGFAIQKEKLETEYQKQVDNMFFYSYRCCMKKHDVS